ncbi:MAG: 3'-5' exonuclease domain-containing protein 2 [Gammaproteobacteria bacterium]|nr:3'-5' exonuclease [Pseudomonadaceae bacterium SI-3]MBK3845752.1 3'-5' exonuclease domain-containing protein 2 [Stutzerimonas xanthomarina]MBU1461906.1 3'-5' exonuclease domain-containing protein 2 [Gammaproteobacteria bacterium]NKQ11325.1 3'-5' exonuclease domain-containing protein 2 [Pseudomonas sp. SST3]HAW24208.1 3'-5' exonuclease [Pseudomonas sp.]
MDIRIPQLTDLERLPRFDGLALDRIVTPSTPEEFAQAVDDILTFAQIGFDTESKPTFTVGELSSGPHLIQFATPTKAYLFQIGIPGCVEAAKRVLETDQVLKVGFGLASDRSRLRTRLGIELRHSVDLGSALRYHGKKGQVGLRGAVAAVLGAGISKSRSVSTSNWANKNLAEAQQRYAANDAYAALMVFLALDAQSRALLLDRVI